MQPSFSTLALSKELLAVLEELGFDTPTSIQALAIPHVLDGSDLIGQSCTGSGKTVAFALPLLQRVSLGQRGLFALVLCPTRELCKQVAREFRKLGRKHAGLSVAILCGGEPLAPQADRLRRGAHLAVGTPGRVIDHLTRRTINVAHVKSVVLDEADRMLDMGFQPAVEEIMRALPQPRQTLLFSATFPESIRRLSEAYQVNPITIGQSGESPSAPEIQQLAIAANASNKPTALVQVLQRCPFDSALIFANLKTTVVAVRTFLSQLGVSVDALHGDLEQFDRDRVMAKFRNGSTRVLVATDVAARGIDLESLDLVVNFDLPAQPDDYVHRIGRTGRAGRQGRAVSLFESHEHPKLEAIKAQFSSVPFETLCIEPSEDPPPIAQSLDRDPPMSTLRISAGRKDKLRPGDIVGALTCEAAGFLASEIGKIETHDRFTYVAIARPLMDRALMTLREGPIKGKKFRVDRVT